MLESRFGAPKGVSDASRGGSPIEAFPAQGCRNQIRPGLPERAPTACGLGAFPLDRYQCRCSWSPGIRRGVFPAPSGMPLRFDPPWVEQSMLGRFHPGQGQGAVVLRAVAMGIPFRICPRCHRSMSRALWNSLFSGCTRENPCEGLASGARLGIPAPSTWTPSSSIIDNFRIPRVNPAAPSSRGRLRQMLQSLTRG